MNRSLKSVNLAAAVGDENPIGRRLERGAHAWQRSARALRCCASSASLACRAPRSARWRASRMFCAFCSATERSRSSSCYLGRPRAPPSISSASAVPSTRLRIFAKALSRVVEVSSLNGEKPQSSVVPSCSNGMYSAASRMRSRTSSGRLDARIDRRDDANENPLIGLHVLPDDLEDALRSGSPASAI